MTGFLQRLRRALLGRPPKPTEQPEEGRYVRHPRVATLGEGLFAPDGRDDVQVLNATARFLWDQLESPRTRDDLARALVSEFDVDAITAFADADAFIDQLLDKGFVVAADADSVKDLPPLRLPQSAELLQAAYERTKAGDWPGALGLCVEARRVAHDPAIAELDILVCRYRLERDEGLVEATLTLGPKLPGLARIACAGLTLAAAHRAGNLDVIKAVACELGRAVTDPFDLPTVPRFVLRAGDRLAVIEDPAIDPVLTMIDDVRSRVANTPQEQGLLDALAQRYRARLGRPVTH